MPRVSSADDFSMMLEANYHTRNGWAFQAQAAMDHGSLYGNNWGAMLGISYSGSFNIRKR